MDGTPNKRGGFKGLKHTAETCARISATMRRLAMQRPMREKREVFAVRLPERVIELIQLEHVKTGRMIGDIVVDAIDNALTRHRTDVMKIKNQKKETLNA